MTNATTRKFIFAALAAVVLAVGSLAATGDASARGRGHGWHGGGGHGWHGGGHRWGGGGHHGWRGSHRGHRRCPGFVKGSGLRICFR
jgi:hypothetical protein